MGVNWAKSSAFRPFAAAQRLLFNMSKIFPWARDLLKRTGSEFITCVEFDIDDYDHHGFQVRLQIKDGFEFCREYFLITKGAMSLIPAFRGYKQARVEMQWIWNGAIFKVSLESRIGRYIWWQKRISWFLAAKAAFKQLTDANDALYRQYQELDKARLVHEQQAIQLKTAYQISQVIHQQLNLDLTLKAIVRAFIEIAGFAAAEVKISRDSDGKEFKRRIRQGKIPLNLAPLVESLIISDCEIGTVKVWLSQNQNAAELQELLKRVIPTINMAVHDALNHNALLDYRNNLELKILERTEELMKAHHDLETTIELLKKAQGVRDRFFANISHEFRTPLALVMGPIEQMLQGKFHGDRKEQFRIILRNAKRLLRLVNQLLDLFRIEAGKMKLRAGKVNIVQLLNYLVQSFESAAKRRGLSLKFAAPTTFLPVYVDKDMFEKIISNLLSNALKFTPKGGTISVVIAEGNGRIGERALESEKAGFVQIKVMDTGIGIPPDRIDKIFDRFYQVDDSHTREHEGTGIGLALTRELVELHRGVISVESELGRGACFIVQLPLGKDHLNQDEIIDAADEVEPGKLTSAGLREEDDYAPEKKVKTHAGSRARAGLPLVLFVEDNADLLAYLGSCLDSEYRIYTAQDGEEGFKKAVEKIPDLIISDVMMPKMDGLQLCERLKTDQRTSHIPVILLTARAAVKDRIGGLETGADDYITKPFDIEELQVRCRNLIEGRRNLRIKFGRDFLVQPSEIVVSSYDHRFLQRVMEVVERHFSNPDFDVALLTREIGLSRMQLHRKLHALTNQSTSRFIRLLRLKRAADLLIRQFGNVAEIAYEVGFSSPSYFSECFRKQFGKLPSEYMIKSS
jgi:signal transduction histidine kinase/DNA-binding response OmpR family regulator